MSIEEQKAGGEGFIVRFNYWMGNARALCRMCGVESVVTWGDDTPPGEPAFALWGWLREHAEAHWFEEEGEEQ
jgi:hypothetical protein